MDKSYCEHSGIELPGISDKQKINYLLDIITELMQGNHCNCCDQCYKENKQKLSEMGLWHYDN